MFTLPVAICWLLVTLGEFFTNLLFILFVLNLMLPYYDYLIDESLFNINAGLPVDYDMFLLYDAICYYYINYCY